MSSVECTDNMTISTKSKDYKTRHFKHENNPNLREMRWDWRTRWWALMDEIGVGGNKADQRTRMDTLNSEAKSLWSHRVLFALDPKDEEDMREEDEFHIARETARVKEMEKEVAKWNVPDYSSYGVEK